MIKKHPPNESARRLGKDRCRTATTLIEVVGTLSVLLVVAVSATSILGATTEIGARNSAARQERVSVQRLAESFRRDIHDCDTIELDQQPGMILLQRDAMKIRYEWNQKGRSIQRTVVDGEGAKGFDIFRLTDQCRPVFASRGDLVTLTLRDNAKLTNRHPWIIEARR